MADENWERSVLEELARESLIERRRARRWGILWRSLTFLLLFGALSAVLVAIATRERVCVDKCTALVEVRGELDATSRASAERVISGLQSAFKSSGERRTRPSGDSRRSRRSKSGRVRPDFAICTDWRPQSLTVSAAVPASSAGYDLPVQTGHAAEDFDPSNRRRVRSPPSHTEKANRPDAGSAPTASLSASVMPTDAVSAGSVGTTPDVSHVGPSPAGGSASSQQRRHGVFPGTLTATRPSSPTHPAYTDGTASARAASETRSLVSKLSDPSKTRS